MSAREPDAEMFMDDPPPHPIIARLAALEAFVAAYDDDAGVDDNGVAKSTYDTRKAVLRAREAIK